MKHRFLGTIGLLTGAALFASAGCGGETGGGGTGGEAPSGGSIVFSASGEVLALGGYGFPPATMDDPAFVDGWEVKFTRLIVTVDKITLSETPDLDTGDQSKTGAVVAEVDGPWAVDLHAGGPLPGKGGADEKAVQIATLDNQNKNGGKPFASDTRYAFGYDVVPATGDATLVNLDEQGKADYELMKQNGYTVLYVGTAKFKGTSCTPTDPVFEALPKTVDFKLGFKSPTSFLNCQNPDLDPAHPLGDEEHQRGIVVKGNQAVTAQITVHTDHPFWQTFIHDSPAHFDQIAAQYVGASGTPTAVLEDMKGIDPTALTDKNGNALPWRSCLSSFTPPAAGQMGFDTTGIPVSPNGDPKTTIRDLYDYMTYNQSTQGHLNADGLCYVKRNYPSPP
ncbi:Hypothetical protein A7982_08347 [Minicystis rosea]|nr:Hypothetical protein A7982_08347 [Minicystis rosea]